MATSNDYFVFVHGWNMRQGDRVAYANTSFKRLYWQGFKGRFAAFNWPTEATVSPPSDPGNFDRSEFIAWKSSEALNDALGKIKATQGELTNLDGMKKITVLAHSMGNIVLDNALASSGMTRVDNAIMSQAAVSSDYFDSSSPTIYTGGVTSPFVNTMNGNRFYQGLPQNGGIGGTSPRFAPGKLNASRVVNLFNPDDYALRAWGYGQALKPSNSVSLSSQWKNFIRNGITDPLPADWGVTFEALLAKTAYRYYRDAAYSIATSTNAGATTYSLVRQNVDHWINYVDADGIPQRTPVYANPTTLSLNTPDELYEAFAFAASGSGRPAGRDSSLAGVARSRYLRQLSNYFDANHAGHSAQFYYSAADIYQYWNEVYTQSMQ